MFCLPIQDENASQKFIIIIIIIIILQWKRKCSRDSSSFWQNVHKGDSIILKRNNLSHRSSFVSQASERAGFLTRWGQTTFKSVI